AAVEELLDRSSGLVDAHVAVGALDDRDGGLRAPAALPPGLVEMRDRDLRAAIGRLALRAGQDLREAGATVDALGRCEAQEVEDRRPDVDVARARAHDDARLESEGEGEQQRNLRRLAVDLATVALETALEEVLAVVRGDDEECVLEVALVGEELEEGFDE